MARSPTLGTAISKLNAQGQVVNASPDTSVQPAINDSHRRAEHHDRRPQARSPCSSPGQHDADPGAGRHPAACRLHQSGRSPGCRAAIWRWSPNASGAPTTGSPGLTGLGTIVQGSVEASNVNVVEEMVNMIETQRAYEMNSKAVETTDQMLQYATQNM